MQSGKAPTPGSTTLPALRIVFASLVTTASRPTRSKPFCTLRKISHSVIDDCDHNNKLVTLINAERQ